MDYLGIALVLIGVGALLLVAEVLVPTGGILVVGSLMFFAVAVGIILYYGSAVEGAVAITALAIGLPLSGYAAVSAWRRLSLTDELERAAAARVPAAVDADTVKGRVGKTVSPMRPSGTVEIDGKRHDALTEGTMLEAGVWVRCVDVKRGQVIVRALEAQPDVSEIAPDASAPAGASAAPNEVARAESKAEPPAREPPKDEPKRPRDDFDDFDIGLK
jgi:membrane-bound serine protease (ClpP class)